MKSLADMFRVSRALSVHSVLGRLPESELEAKLRVARFVWFPAAVHLLNMRGVFTQ